MKTFLRSLWFRRLILVFVCTLVWHLPVPWGLSQEAWHLFVLFSGAIFAVLLNALSVLLSSLFAIILTILTGTLTTEKAFSGFSEPFLLLILAAFLVSKAVIKSGLGKRMALLLIRRFGSSTLRLGYCIFAVDALIGPAIPSNTARSGILFPIVNALALDTGSFPDQATRKKSGSFLMMCSITSLTVSSALWLTAMAANPVGLSIAGQFGVKMTFTNWFLTASIPCLVAMVLLPRVLYKVFPPEKKKTPEAREAAEESLARMGALSREEWITAVVFLGMIFLWGMAGFLQIDMAVVALLGLAVLMLTNVYRLEDLRTGGGDALETYIWFAILYVLSTALNEMGLMATLGRQISGLLGYLNWMSVYVLLIILYVMFHYLFVSQTAQLLALYAVFLEVGINALVPPALMAFGLSFATNYFAAITPQASSANVLFVGSGYLEAKEVYWYGLLVTLINLAIFLLASPWMLWASGLGI